jgi:hypothetical protein
MFVLFLLLSSVAFEFAVAFEFGNLRNLRNILGAHAFASTVYKQIQEEIFQHQFDVLVLTDNPMQLENFMKENSVSVLGVCIAIIGYNMYYSPNSSLFKLQELMEYKNLRLTARFVIFVFVFVFLRDIQNAI